MQNVLIVLLALGLIALSVFSVSLYGKLNWLQGRYNDLLAKYKEVNEKYGEKAKAVENLQNQVNQLQSNIAEKDRRIAELEQQINTLRSQSSGISWADWDRINKAYNELSSKYYQLENNYRKVLKAWCPIMANFTVYCSFYPEDPECQKYTAG